MPNLFIVGAQKSGTTSLHNYLSEHPEIYMSKVKEPSYFSKFPGSIQIGEDITEEEYYRLFKDVKNEKIIGEGSVSYLYDPSSAKAIYDVNPNAKIIILLRDPVDRTFSHFLKPDNKMTFEQKINKDFKNIDEENPNYENIVNWGLYPKQVKRYLDIFHDQVKIIIFEEFFSDPTTKIKEILEFLGLEPKVHDFSLEIHKKSYKPRNQFFQKIISNKLMKKAGNKVLPINIRQSTYAFLRGDDSQKNEISKKDEKILIEFYKDSVSSMEKILKRKLPWKSSINHS